jgi:hypothetical protein
MTDIALTGTATASSYKSGNLPSMAIDGVISSASQWFSGSGDNNIQFNLDLGSVQSFTQVVLTWYLGYVPTTYSVQISSDNVNWTTIASYTTGPGYGGVTTINGNWSARYIKVPMPVTAAGSIGLEEMQVFGSAAVTLNPLTFSGSFQSNAAPGSIVGTLGGTTSGSTLALSNIMVGSTAYPNALTVVQTSTNVWQVEVGTALPPAPSTITFAAVETLTGATNSPKTTTGLSISETASAPPPSGWSFNPSLQIDQHAKNSFIYASGDTTSPFGGISAPNNAPYIVFSGPDTWSTYAQMLDSSFGQTLSVSNDSFPENPPPYTGPYTQFLTIYVPLGSAKGAWGPQANQPNCAFEINMQAGNALQTYPLETDINFRINTATPNQVQCGFVNGWDLLDAGEEVPFQLSPLTATDWYTITETFYKAGNMTTDPGIAILAIYNSAKVLVNYFIRPGGNQWAPSIPAPLPTTSQDTGANLLGPASLWVGFWQTNFGGNNLGVSGLGWYSGAPNPTTRPILVSAYNQTAKHGQPFSLQLAWSQGAPTSFSGHFYSTRLSISNTGLISGTPPTAGTYQIEVAAANAAGVDAIRINLVVS